MPVTLGAHSIGRGTIKYYYLLKIILKPLRV
ncbi:hypothetical protein FPSE_10777 [Fusarium pseudograminearum CS3096]|uniref:Uncharacterized protein n=1 Tax=Fusarium pseudograminearum (strain CS3096) TaxID=1028729 RepID=K3UC74_FUSPC|nr:hypothetical protein FPSE_10777 [Fusarium pseudograminearum CS3096]EKJ69051.1 hypothetical protein FPSE_10777 [Fusarium pseudograminearum CS3096]